MTVLEQQNLISITFVKTTVKKIIQNQYIQQWKADIMLSEKCSMYKCYKQNFSCEKYLALLPDKLRYFVTKFRICNTKLPIEKGRYDNTPIHMRHCTLCNNNTVGDEYHFLLDCPALTDARIKYLPKYYQYHINMIKFNDIMSTDSNKLLFRLAKFLACTLALLK
jgi:hypothetical protein